MLALKLSDVDASALQQLISAGATESRHLEFKRELPDFSDRGKVSFLRSITAFANTAGGDVIYGMDAKDGVALRLVPLEMPSRDAVLLRLENLCAAGVEPRLAGVEFGWIDLPVGGSALIVRVARSWNGPHRVTTANHTQFYGRTSAGVSAMDVGELRQAFTYGAAIAERIRAFKDERLLAVVSGQTPMPLRAGATLVLHVIPLSAFTSDRRLDVTGEAQGSALDYIQPLGSSGSNNRLNLEGRLTYRNPRDGQTAGYAQLYRNGAIEGVTVYDSDPSSPTLPGGRYELDVLRGLASYFRALSGLDVQPPAYVYLSLVNMSGFRLGVGTGFFAEDGYAADRGLFAFPDVAVKSWDVNLHDLMRPIFDMVWNAFGYQRSFNYDDNGVWKVR